MTIINESSIEKFVIDILDKSGYQYVYAPKIATNSETPQQTRFEDVLLLERLRDTLLPKRMSGQVRVQLSQGEAAA